MGVQVIDMQNVWQECFNGDLNFKQYASKELSYESFTTFWQDFTIAEHFGGVPAIKDTYRRASAEWKGNYKYFTELVLVLKTKSEWFAHMKNERFAELYGNQYSEASTYARANFNSEERAYFNNVFGIIDATVSIQEGEDFKAFAAREFGYDCLTNYWQDFTSAELSGGVEAIEKVYQELLEKSKQDYRLLTELSLILNHKIWKFHDRGNMEFAALYNRLWDESCQYAYDHLTGDALTYYVQVLD